LETNERIPLHFIEKVVNIQRKVGGSKINSFLIPPSTFWL